MRKFVCATVVTLVAITISLAADYNGSVVSIEGNKITIQIKGKKGAPGEKKTFAVADNVVVKSGKVNFDKAAKKATVEEGDAIEGGLKSATFNEEAIKKGLNVRVTTEGEGDNEKVTKVIVTKGKKKAAGN